MSLAWARDQVAQPCPWSPRRETRSKTKNETLQLSVRRDGLALARLAEVPLCSRTQFAKTKTKRSLNHYQHNVLSRKLKIMIFNHQNYKNLSIQSSINLQNQNPHPIHILPQNPHPNHVKHKGLATAPSITILIHNTHTLKPQHSEFNWESQRRNTQYIKLLYTKWQLPLTYNSAMKLGRRRFHIPHTLLQPFAHLNSPLPLSIRALLQKPN